MKKKFEKPEAEIIVLGEEDIITTSSYYDNELPLIPFAGGIFDDGED